MIPQEYALAVHEGLLWLRGWPPDHAPAEVRLEAWETIDRHDPLFTMGFNAGRHPDDVATEIQIAEWGFWLPDDPGDATGG